MSPSRLPGESVLDWQRRCWAERDISDAQKRGIDLARRTAGGKLCPPAGIDGWVIEAIPVVLYAGVVTAPMTEPGVLRLTLADGRVVGAWGQVTEVARPRYLHHCRVTATVISHLGLSVRHYLTSKPLQPSGSRAPL